MNNFITTQSGGYFFVTGLSGFGKTALLANWVRSLERSNENICYHFISNIYGKTADEDFALRNLCQQLTAFHDLRGVLPSSSSEIRTLYANLIQLPPANNQKVILVIDGLDEAVNWISSDLFPPSTPDGVFVIYSARESAGKDWITDLGLSREHVPTMELKTLGYREIADLLTVTERSKRWAEDAVFIKTMFERSGGDPFYLHYLVEDINNGFINSMVDLEKQPAKLNGYLDSWWKEASKVINEQAIIDLFGYLLVAKGRINRDDLINISNEDALNGMVFERIINQVQRFVIGNEKDGYTFGHPRFREYLSQARIKKNEQRPLLERLIKYCAEWPDHRSHYAFRFYAKHLAEAGLTKDLFNLFKPAWYQAKWTAFGSYTSLIEDFDIAVTRLLEEDPPDYAQLCAIIIARQTARQLITSFPQEIYISWVRMGELDRVMSLLRTVNNVKEAELYAKIAVELLELKNQGQVTAEKSDFKTIVTELLSQAIEMLVLERSSIRQLEILDLIKTSIISGSDILESSYTDLLEKLEDFINSLHDRVMKGAAMGMLAEVMLTSNQHRSRAPGILDAAIGLLNKLAYIPDRTVVTAYVLPALKIIKAEAIPPLVRAAYSTSNLFGDSSLGKSPLVTLLDKWAPAKGSNKHESVEMIEELVAICEEHEPSGFVTGCIAMLYFDLGEKDKAICIIDNLWQRSPLEGARSVLAISPGFYQAAPEIIRTWLNKYKPLIDDLPFEMPVNRELFISGLARLYALTGQWVQTYELLGSVSDSVRKTGIKQCLGIAGKAFTTSPSQLLQTVNQLIALNDKVALRDKAEVFAAAALEIMNPFPDIARKYVNSAIGSLLGDLPEGDSDQLRHLLSIAYHELGLNERATESLGLMKWRSVAARSFARLIEVTSDDQAAILQKYTGGLLEELDKGRGGSLYSDSLISTMNAASVLAEKQYSLAHSLVAHVLSDLNYLRLEDQVECYSITGGIYMHFDTSKGTEYFASIIEWLKQNLLQNVQISNIAIMSLYKQLGTVASKSPDQIRHLIEATHELHRFFPDLGDTINLECAYATAILSFDVPGFHEIMQKQVSLCSTLGERQPPALLLRRMLSEYTGRMAGAGLLQTTAANEIGASIATASIDDATETVKLMTELLNVISSIESSNDLAQALVDFFTNCVNCKPELHLELSELCLSALENARGVLEPNLQSIILRNAIELFHQMKNQVAVTRGMALLDDPNEIQKVNVAIDIMDKKIALEPLSLFEKEIPEGSLKTVVLYEMKIEGKTKEVMFDLVSTNPPWDRLRLFDDLFTVMMAPVNELGGTDLIESVINQIEQTDQNFYKAAELIANE